MRTLNAQERPILPSATQKRTKTRIVILMLLSIGTMINYLDRTILGIVAPKLTSEIHIDPAMMGIVFSAFAWTYALAQIPGGMFLDRFGNKLTYALSIFFWSTFTLLQSFSVGLKSLLLLRLGLGISEAPCFPVNSRVVSKWFPQHERARATATYTVGEYIGLAAFSPLLFLILEHHGWRTLFFLTGGLGIAFTFVWWKFYHEPHQSKTANKAELEYIGVENTASADENIPFNWPDAKRLLCCRQIIGASLGQFAGNTTLVFFLTWFPTYLANERHLPWLHVGFFASWPFLAAAIGIFFGGWVSDKILKKTRSVNISRKLPIISGLLLSSCIIIANWVESNTAVIIIMSIAFFGQGMVGLGWTLISDIAPKNMGGLTGGIFNFCANMASIITPLIIGVIISMTGNFFYALIYIGLTALIGVIAYIFIIGDIKRIVLK
ncbi:4-hydroxyphenylpyruvate dioxygenase [Klebsiella oxytoca]|jgi:ACS family D-galactonate transporter-like MFS transporter|uniref:MFS transporter n=1 Tax=Klebsiella oxytoca TaxID=571 RepID=A0AAD3UIN1_KLEOX|nr:MULTISPECIES: MFS transporter [Klebsiella]AVL80900.1 MFS transporter [Klebsiella oxytoca]AYZ53820.1 MFS transporter [Klebsiella oxytoca]EHS89475.1 D-galactonate transporter [Klebsiella oxytoca 10-5243]EHT9906407.1 MFS transporter [Klebsiella oxytoca]EIX9053717.1 MFS transporter [Klebsiella oxytoca]